MADQPHVPVPGGPSGSARFESIGLSLGAGGAMLLAGALVPARDTLGSANIALLLCLVVVLAALTSRLAGIGTAVAAALSFNFFHTQPYQSLRISDGRDITTVCLLVVVGIVVSWIGEWRRSTARRADLHRIGEHSLESVIARIAAGGSEGEVFDDVRHALVRDLRLADCRFESTPTAAVPRIDRHGGLVSRHLRLGERGFELPSDGAAIEVAAGGHVYGQLVLVPRDGSSSNVEQRRAAVALADLYALVLDHEHRAASSRPL